MKSFKYLFGLLGLSFILLSFSNCNSSKLNEQSIVLEETAPFTVIEAYYHKWIAGVQGGRSGTNVFITIENLSDGVTIKNIYFEERATEAKNSPLKPKQYAGYFKNENNRNTIMDINPNKEAQNTPPLRFPLKLSTNEAVISYLQNGTIKFFKLSNLVEKELLPYPSSNPNGID